MAAPTYTVLTSGNTTADASSFTTASIAPAANRLLLVAIYVNPNAGVSTAGITVTGLGLTWEKVVETNPGTAIRHAVWFRAKTGGSAPAAGALTISPGGSTANIFWDVIQVDGFDTSGTNGSGAIAQSVSARPTALTSVDVPFPNPVSADGLALAVVGINVQEAPAAPAGWTSISTATQSANANGYRSMAARPAIQDITSSWTSSANAFLAGIEVKAANTAPTATASAFPNPPSAGGSFILNGGDSDTDNNITTRSWSQISGPACTLRQRTVPGLPTTGRYAVAVAPSDLAADTTATFRYTVTDAGGLTASADVVVTLQRQKWQGYVGGVLRGLHPRPGTMKMTEDFLSSLSPGDGLPLNTLWSLTNQGGPSEYYGLGALNRARLVTGAAPAGVGLAACCICDGRGQVRGMPGQDVDITLHWIPVSDPTTVEQNIYLGARQSSARNSSGNGWAPQDGYAVRYGTGPVGNRVLEMSRFVGGVQTVLVQPTGLAPWAVGGQRMRLYAKGAVLRVKVWDASVAEPGAWNIDLTDASPVTAPGYMAFAFGTSPGGPSLSCDIEQFVSVAAV